MKRRLIKLIMFLPVVILMTALFVLQLFSFPFQAAYLYVVYGDIDKLKKSKMWCYEATNWWFNL